MAGALGRADALPAIRPVNVPRDRARLLALDTSFVTDRIYTVQASAASFTLVEQAVAPPIHKAFPLDDDMGDDRLWQQGFVAETGDALAGFAALRYEAWNRRAAIWHLYVAPAWRGRGIGAALLAAVEEAARAAGARTLWLETSNVNYPAIHFYRRMGFAWCGLDTALYDPAGDAAGETALYFARPLE